MLKSCSELLSTFREFNAMIQTQFSKTIKLFRSDNARDYTFSDFETIFTTQDALPHLSCPSTSQQNGRAERKHCHILDTVRSLLIFASLPKPFWGEAALTAVYNIS